MDVLSYLVGGGLVVLGIYLFISAQKTHLKLDRDRFERTNKHGTQVYESYDELRNNRRERSSGGFKAAFGCLALMIGPILILAASVSSK